MSVFQTNHARAARLLAALLTALPLAATAEAPAAVCADNDPSCANRQISAAFVASIVGAPASAPITGAQLDKHTEDLARQVRCPVCQGSSIGDSPSETARNMKLQVHDLLALGFSDEQVFAYFEASYGEFIRLAPKAQGFNALVWILPALLMLFGAVAAYFYLRGRTRKPSHEPVAPATTEDSELDPFLRRVRAMTNNDAPSGDV